MGIEEIRVATPKRSNAAVNKLKAKMEEMRKKFAVSRKKMGLNDQWLVQSALGGAGVVVIDYLFGNKIRSAFGKWAGYALPVVAGVGGYLLFHYGKAGSAMKGIGLGLVAGGIFILAKQLLIPETTAATTTTTTTPVIDPKTGKPAGIGYGGSMLAPAGMLALKYPTYYGQVQEVEGIQEGVDGIQEDD